MAIHYRDTRCKGSIKDQIFILCAVARNMIGFEKIFGLPEGEDTFGGTEDEIGRKMAATRMKTEHKIRSVIIGKEIWLCSEQRQHQTRMIPIDLHDMRRQGARA